MSFDSAAGEAGATLGLHARERYPLLFLPHVAGGIVALIVGLFQFMPKLRGERPRLHRRLGITYLTAVAIGGVTGLPLSLLIPQLVPPDVRSRFFPMAGSFFVLSIAWSVISAIAYARARERRFTEHRAWMMRSYALTFAAVTVRLVSGPLLFLTGDVVFAVNAAVLTWPLNLAVAEWLIQRFDGGQSFGSQRFLPGVEFSANRSSDPLESSDA